VGYGTLDIANAQKTDENEYRRRTARGEPTTDDLVLVREGGGTGKCALVSQGEKFSLGQRVMMMRPNPDVVLPRFLLHLMLSPQVQQEQISKLCKGSASPHLNISALRVLPLKVPSLEEQHRIVEEIDLAQAEVEVLKRHQAESAAELDALLPSILDRAFSGTL
jgi:type I restriction enzyme S subunit